jgi:putative tricarboxylic transport membrane protein
MIAHAVNVNNLSPHPWVVVNRSGGAHAVAYSHMFTQRGNPHFLMGLSAGPAVGSIMNNWTNSFEATADIIALMAWDEMLLVTLSTGPYQTIQSFISAARARPGTLRYGSTNRHNMDHLAFELIREHVGIDINYVQFDGTGDLMTALLGGHVDVGVAKPSSAIGLVEARSFTPIVFMSEQRLSGIWANVPTFTELGHPQIVTREYRGVAAPRGLTQAQRQFYENTLRRVMDTPEFKNYMADNHLINAWVTLDEANRSANEEARMAARMFREVAR